MGPVVVLAALVEHGVVRKYVANVQFEKIKALGDLGDDSVVGDVAMSSCAYSSMGTRAERLTGYSVTRWSKRAAVAGEKIELAISLTMHHLPRQSFGGKVYLFGGSIQFNRSVGGDVFEEVVTGLLDGLSGGDDVFAGDGDRQLVAVELCIGG